MKHKITMEGKSYRLRPVTVDDAQTIIDIRQPSNERNKYIGRISENPQDQIDWIERYYERDNDYYFIAENLFTGEAECLIRLSDVAGGKGEWGSTVTKEGSFAVAEATMLMLDAAFGVLELDEVYSYIIADNVNAINHHDNIGDIQRGLIKNHYELEGVKYDAVYYCLSKEQYEKVARPKLLKGVETLYKRNLRNGERKKAI